MMRYGSDRTSQHGADEQSRPEDTARVARSITGGNGEKFQNHQQQHQLERHPSVQSLTDKPIPYAENLRDEPAHQSDQQPACYWLEPGGLLRKPQELRPHAQQELREGDRNQAATHAEHSIDSELDRMDQLILWNLKEGVIAEKHAQNDPRSRRGQHYRAHHWRVEITHNLLKRK